MMPTLVNEAAPVPPPAYHRAQARLGPALHIDALTLVNMLYLLMLCRLAVSLDHHRCPPKKNWANAVPLNASLAACFSSFTCNGLLFLGGPPWFDKSLSLTRPPLSSLWLPSLRSVPISSVLLNTF